VSTRQERTPVSGRWRQALKQVLRFGTARPISFYFGVPIRWKGKRGDKGSRGLQKPKEENGRRRESRGMLLCTNRRNSFEGKQKGVKRLGSRGEKKKSSST